MLKKKNNKSGFTLLEVMIAITIMAIAFSAILSSQSSSIILVRKAKETNIAGWLAHSLMVESEHLYEGKPFNELPKEASEAFPAPYADYTWKREIKELKLPDLPINTKDDSATDPVRLLAKVLTKYLSDAIRELVITVSWKRGKGEQHITITTYLINLNADFNFGI